MSDETTPQGDAAMSPASAGSVVAWAVVCGDCVDSTFTDRDEAVEWACGLIPPPQIVPLYRSPTLTDAEREAVEEACNFYSHECETDGATDDDYQNAAALRGLLERMGGAR